MWRGKESRGGESPPNLRRKSSVSWGKLLLKQRRKSHLLSATLIGEGEEKWQWSINIPHQEKENEQLGKKEGKGKRTGKKAGDREGGGGNISPPPRALCHGGKGRWINGGWWAGRPAAASCVAGMPRMAFGVTLW